MPRFPACLHDGFVSHTAQCSFPTSSPSLETRTHCFAQYKILAREITVRSGRWTQESICCSSFPPLSICVQLRLAWEGRGSCSWKEWDRFSLLFYQGRRQQSTWHERVSLEVAEAWLGCQSRTFHEDKSRAELLVGDCCSSRWSKRLSLLFPFSSLPYSFVKVDGNMSICLWSLWGFFYSKHGHVQQHLERHGGRSCNLYITEFLGKGAGFRNLTLDVSIAKISIESQRGYARFAVLIWDQNMDIRYTLKKELFLLSQTAGQNCTNTLQSKHISITVIFLPVAMRGCHL